MGQRKVSLFSEVSSFWRLKCMQEWYLGWEKVSCLEVSSVQECPHRERERERFHCIET